MGSIRNVDKNVNERMKGNQNLQQNIFSLPNNFLLSLSLQSSSFLLWTVSVPGVVHHCKVSLHTYSFTPHHTHGSRGCDLRWGSLGLPGFGKMVSKSGGILDLLFRFVKPLRARHWWCLWWSYDACGGREGPKSISEVRLGGRQRWRQPKPKPSITGDGSFWPTRSNLPFSIFMWNYHNVLMFFFTETRLFFFQSSKKDFFKKIGIWIFFLNLIKNIY